MENTDKQYSPPILFPALSETKDLDELNQAITDYLHNFGFSDYLFISGLKKSQPDFLSCTLKGLTTRYFSEKMHRHDMLVSHATNSKKPVFASALYKYLLDAPVVDDALERQRQIHHLFKSFGFYDAYVVPITPGDTKEPSVMFCLFRYCRPLDLGRSVHQQELMLVGLGEEIAAALKTHRGDNTAIAKIPRLNPKPLRVLSTFATSDQALTDIAKQLNLSIVTVNKHLETARRTFKVKTNQEAVRQAWAAGLIDLD